MHSVSTYYDIGNKYNWAICKSN